MAGEFNKTLNIYINSGEAQKVLDTLTGKQSKLQDALSKTTDPKEVKRLTAEFAKLAEPIDRATKKLNGQLGPSLKEMESLVAKLRNQMRRAEGDADYSKVVAQYAQAKAALVQMQGEIKKVELAHQGVAKSNPFGRVLEYAKGAFLGGAMLQVYNQAATLIKDFIGGSFQEALDAEEAGARFEATLDNLGRSDAFDRIMRKADEMAAKFEYLDNDDVVGVFNKLIDYGKLTEKQMNDLLPVIINFAAKQRISLDESTGVIVKALEGNGKALKQYGIDIKDAETDTERLNVVMTTLKDKVAEAGEAFEKTGNGGIAVTKQEVADLKEEIGTGLLPMLKQALSALNLFIKGIRHLGEDVGDAKLYGGGITGFITALFVNSERRDMEALVGTEAEQIEESAKSLVLSAKKAIETRKLTLQQLLDSANKSLADPNLDARSRKVKERYVELLTVEFDTRKLGSGGSGGGDTDKSKGSKKIDQTKDDQRKLLEILRDAETARALFEESEEMKRLTKAAQYWEEQRQLAHGNRDLLKAIDEAYFAEALQIQVEFGRKSMEERIKQQREQTARLEALGSKAQTGLQALGSALGKNDANTAAGLELEMMRSSGRKRLDMYLKLLDQEKKMALSNTELTENEKELIRERYRQAGLAAEQQYYIQLLSTIINFISQATQVLDTFAQAKTNRENQELERDRKVNEGKKKNLERQLKGKELTQQEYDRKVAEIEKEQEKKERAAKIAQFRREQRMAIARAFISAAEGSLKTVAEWGMPLALPFLALVAAQLIGQVALINSQKPQFARGGKLHGPSHADNNGMPVTNPRTGQVQAYLEGGEGITNKRTMSDRRRYSVSGTPSQIISSLNAMHGGVHWESGATLTPAWKTLRPQPMNFGAIRRAYATGGRFGVAESPSSASSSDSGALQQTLNQMTATLVYLSDTVNALQQQLAAGLHASVSLSQHEQQQARLDAIRRDATYTPSSVRVKSNPKINYGYVTEEVMT